MVTTQKEPENRRIALFIDLENMVGMVNQLGLPADLKPVLDRLLQYGRVIVRRAFGDLDAACNTGQSVIKRVPVRSMLYRNGCQLEDIPTLGRKNCADIRLTVEALSVAYCYEDIDTFAILASDRDYRPVIEKLREMGRTTIGIGGSAHMTNAVYVNSCDVFIYYETLFATENPLATSGVTDADDAPLSEERNQLLEEYCKLLSETIDVFENQGIRAVGGALVPQMRSRKPDFDPALVNLRTFRELAEEAQRRGMVTITAAGQDVELTRRRDADSPVVTNPVTTQYPFDEKAPDAAFHYYSEAISRKLRAEMLPKSMRDQAYELAGTVLSELSEPWEGESEPIPVKLPLDELSQRVTERLHSDDHLTDQPAVFKLLYSLFRGGCFVCELTNHAYRPLIMGLSPGAEHLDRVFMRNTIRVLRMEDPNLPLYAEPLGRLFETDAATVQLVLDDLGV